MLRSLCFFLTISFALFSRAQTGYTTKSINSCHYDETLSMDVWTSYAPKEALQTFKAQIRKKYGKNIDIHVRKVLSPDEFYDRVRAGFADIISPSHNFLKDERTQFIKNKLILPLDRKLLPNLARIDTRFIENNFVTQGDSLFGIPLAAGGYSLLYDRKHFKDPPQSWNVLWQEAYKGRYSISKEFYEANIYITGLALGYKPAQLSDVAFVDTPKFRAKLKHLLKHANYWHGAPHTSDLGKSVLTTAWGLSHSVYEDDDRWLFAFTQEGVTFWSDYMAVTRNINRSELAQTVAMEWMNFALGDEYQIDSIIRKSRYISPLKTQFLPAGLRTPLKVKELNFLTEKAIYWPLLSTRNRNGLKKVYDEILAEIESEAGKTGH